MLRRTRLRSKQPPPWIKPDRVYVRPTVMPLNRGVYGGSVVPAPKPEEPARSEAYRRIVASLACRNCGIVGFGQCAHPNTGKGASMKTDDRLSFCLCGPRPGEIGCHARFDQGALFSKAVRRAIEPAWGADTRRQVVAMGKWPQGLPMFDQPGQGDS